MNPKSIIKLTISDHQMASSGHMTRISVGMSGAVRTQLLLEPLLATHYMKSQSKIGLGTVYTKSPASGKFYHALQQGFSALC